MKRLGSSILVAFMAIACVVAASTACPAAVATNPDGTAVDSVGIGDLEAIVDQIQFELTGPSQVVVNRSGNDFAIVGTSSSGARLSINMINTSAPGTYGLGSGGAGAGTYANGASTWLSTLSGATGTITFTTLSSTRASGTFSFTGKPVAGTPASGDKAVTSGSFNVKFGLN